MILKNQIKDSNSIPLRKHLKPHLESFEKIEQWTDLGQWLQKTAKLLELYPTKNIPMKKNLSKRLSQCLNNSLPIGILRTTLFIYSLIFEFLKQDKELMIQQMYIYSFGLFPFFVKASIQVKPEILKIFQIYIIPLGVDIVPMLTGILNCLLPGLDEKDDNIKNQIYDLIKQVNESVGNLFFMNALWTILLKNNKVRINIFKVLFKKIKELYEKNPKENLLIIYENMNEQQIKLFKQIQVDNFSINSYFTNSSLISNALNECLSDSIEVKSITLDFMLLYIQFNNDIFSQEQWIGITKTILMLFKENDLRLVKRITKFLFQKSNLEDIKIDDYLKIVNFLSEVFGLFFNESKNHEQNSTPFIILTNIATQNYDMAQYLLLNNASAFFKFCYFNGFKSQKLNSTLVLDETKKFIKNFPLIIESVIKQFQTNLLQNDVFNDIDFLTFILKFIILDPSLPYIIQLNFIGTLLLISGKLMTLSLSNKTISQKEIIIEQHESIEVLIEFSFNCINQFKDMMEIKEIKDKKGIFEESLDFFIEFVKNQIQSIDLTLKLVYYYSKIFEIIIILDHNCRDYSEQTDDLPQWIFLLFDMLNYSSEIIVNECLKILFNFFEFEKKYPNIQYIQRILYQSSSFQDQHAHIIFTKLIEIIEIEDFKELFIGYYLKFIKMNSPFVLKYILQLLDLNRVENLNKILKVWKYTQENTDPECEYILNNTVKPIFRYKNLQCPITANYLKKWLTYSPLTLQIILDSILKKQLLITNWNVQEQELLYNYPYDCLQFLEQISNLKFILEICGEYFINFLDTTNVNKDFNYYQDELNQSLQGFFDSENDSIYIYFLMKIFMRFFVGQYNDQFEDNSLEHKKFIPEIKKEIIILFQKIIKTLQNQQRVIDLCVGLLPYVLRNLNQSFKMQSIYDIIQNLNFLKFLSQKQNCQVSQGVKMILSKSMNESICILIQGLTQMNVFLIEESNEILMYLYNLLAQNFKISEIISIFKNVQDGYLEAMVQTYSIKRLSIKEEEIQRAILLVLFKGVSNIYNFLFKQQKIDNYQGQFLEHFHLVFDQMLKIWDIRFIKDQDLFGLYQKRFFKQDLFLGGVQEQVIDILRILFQSHSKIILENFINRWIELNSNFIQSTYFKRKSIIESVKLLDILISLNLDIEDFLLILKSTNHFLKINHQKRQREHRKQIIFLNSTIISQENDLLSFLYCYLKISEIKNISFYSNLFEILKLFENSLIPQTLLWLFDILNLLIDKVHCSQKDFEYIKFKYHQFLVTIMGNTVDIDNQKILVKYEQNDIMIFPLNPNVHEKLKHKKNGNIQYFIKVTVSQTFIKLFNAYFNEQNKIIYSPQKIHFWIQKFWKTLKKQDHWRSKLILNLIKENKNFLQVYRSEILDIFQADQFFNCSLKMLKIWSKIIKNYLTEVNSNIVNHYFEKINFSSMFISRNSENIQRIKSFQRICFIIFSGTTEQFVNRDKLKIFLLKIKEVLKDKQVHPNLIILIFFSLRILILRIKEETLDDLFESMWSSILFLIEQMIKGEEIQIIEKKDDIIIAALKLLELINYSNLSQFHLHRWAFVYEFFGVEFREGDQENKSTFVFKPILASSLKSTTNIIYNIKGENRKTEMNSFMNVNSSNKIHDVVQQYLLNQLKDVKKSIKLSN